MLAEVQKALFTMFCSIASTIQITDLENENVLKLRTDIELFLAQVKLNEHIETK